MYLRNLAKRGARCGADSVELFVPAGHFYSPIVDPRTISQLPTWTPFSPSEVDLNTTRQLEVLRDIAALGVTFPSHKESGFRYYSENDQFGSGDAFCYSGMLRLLNPKRVLEIGSGFSTAVLLDTRPFLTALEIIRVVEPFPDRLLTLLREDDPVDILMCGAQELNNQAFEDLEAGDIVFIDSTHVAKTGSDVLWELLWLMPRLPNGVWVHIHDVFWPFEYPHRWAIVENRSWNELYFLRAWLAFNSSVSIQFFAHYLACTKADEWDALLPREISNPGGGFWMRIER